MTKNTIMKICMHGFLIIAAFVAVFPLIIMIMGSFKTASEFAINPAGFPKFFTLENYYKVFSFSSGLLIRTFFNSVFVSVSYTVLALFISALAAFGFAKFKFPGQNLIFTSLLAMMMVPVELSIAPQYILFSKIHWLNSYQVQIIPGIASVFGLFLLTQYIRTIPDALVESAKVDGAGTWRIFFQIILPLAKPAMGALGILLFLHKWNDYLWPLIMVSKEELMPLMVIIPIINDKGAYMITPWELILTACVIGVIPLIGIFFMFQDKFMSNVTIGAVRE